MRHLLAVLATASLLLGIAAIPAGAARTTSMHAATAPAGTLVVKLNVDRFAQKNRKTSASGVATATLTGVSGATTSIKQRVTLAAGSGSTCKVLHLFLQQLDLKLLGLNAHLDKVQLDITGQKNGGVLGSLFCSLSKGLKASSLKAANARLASHPVRAMTLRAHLTAQTAQAGAPVCQVLDLVLGPLNLNLLGLVVDLNQVHLSVTATPGGGVLGDLFCKLGQPPAA